MADSRAALGPVLEAMGLDGSADSLTVPSWNGRELEQVYPWGTIRKASPEANLATAQELPVAEQDEIRQRTWQYLDVLDYASFMDTPVTA